jgi:chloramphenicol-sensitive protein RarD
MKLGIALSVLSSLLFAVLYYFVTFLEPLSGESVFAWRILLGLPALVLINSRSRGWADIGHVAGRMSREPKLLFWMMLASMLIGVQLWLFVWAPLHQHALDVTLGYFLLPIFMVAVGRLVYGERLSRLQSIAVAIAAIGVLNEIWRLQALSWVTAVVVFGYPPYFIVRRALRMRSLTTLWFDLLFLAPLAIFVLFNQSESIVLQFTSTPLLFVLVPAFGLISALALVCYLSAAKLLPLALFGLLGYVEPILLFAVAFLLLGEPVESQAWYTYIAIWSAMAILAIEGARAWLRQWRQAKV